MLATSTAIRPAVWPAALVPAVKLLWSRTLFPGSSSIAERPRWRSALILLTLSAVLLYPCINFRLLEPDEGRYAEIPREMLATGDWVVPRLQSEPYLDKPPLMYWAIATSYQIFGVSAGSARLVPALAVQFTILLTYIFGCLFVGRRNAFRGALLLALMPGLTGIGRLLTLDGLLTLWVTFGLYSGFVSLRSDMVGPRWRRANIWICACACGLGVLTKGPVAIVLVLGPLFAWSWFNSERSSRPSGREWLIYMGIVVFVNAPWYVMIAMRQPSFVQYFFWQHNVERFLNPFDHLEPVWYYAPFLIGGLLPASFWIWQALKNLVSGDPATTQTRTPELAFFLTAGLGCVLFFSASGSKLPTYILPAFPPLALALGVLLPGGDMLFSRGRRRVLVCWAIVFAAVQSLALPIYAHVRSPLREETAVRAYCGDPAQAVVCFPRTCDSVGFYLGRTDITSTRSKHVHLLIAELLSRPRTVVLLTHRHSLEALRFALPTNLKMTPVADFRHRYRLEWLNALLGETPWGLCDIAIVERLSGGESR